MKNLPVDSKETFKALGLMSGTSMDGIDVALIETDGFFHVRQLASFSASHDSVFYAQMKTIENTMKKIVKNKDFLLSPFIQKITQEVDCLHTRAVLGLCKKYDLTLSDIDIIGYHGQTVYHRPEEKLTVQIGNPKILSHQLKIPVMGHVRLKDIQMGGQGAPVAPIYHQALIIQNKLSPALVINCGGISNISVVLGEKTTDLSGFDMGPGNGLLDRWVNKKTEGRECMDKDGKYALKGQIHPEIIDDLFRESCIKNQENYYEQKPPKSLNIRDFSWPKSLELLSLEDGCATLAAFTAYSIVDAFQYISGTFQNVILAGGGWHHPVILGELKDAILKKYGQSIRIVTADEIGWSSQYLEAELMAYLAVRCIKNLPITFPATTGVSEPLTGGEIFCPE